MDENGKPPFDEQFAAKMIGKTMLIGLSYFSKEGEPLRNVQMFGRVQAVSKTHGISVELEGQQAGQIYNLPPDLRSVKVAPSGEYRLRMTSEVIVDPDFLSTWTIYER